MIWVTLAGAGVLLQVNGIVPGVAFERELGDEAGRLDARNRVHVLQHALEQPITRVGRLVQRTGRVDVQRQHVFHVESLVDLQQAIEARDQESRDQEQGAQR